MYCAGVCDPVKVGPRLFTTSAAYVLYVSCLILYQAEKVYSVSEIRHVWYNSDRPILLLAQSPLTLRAACKGIQSRGGES